MVGMRAHGAGHVVGESVEVHLAGGDILEVTGLHRELDVVFGPETLGVERVGTAHLDVGAVPVHTVHLELVGEHVGGIARTRVAQDEAVHIAHLELRVLLVSELDHAAMRHELMVQGLVALLRRGLDGGRRTLKALDEAGLHHAPMSMVPQLISLKVSQNFTLSW